MKLNEVTQQVLPVNQMQHAKLARQLAYNITTSFVPQDWEAAAQKTLQRYMGQLRTELMAELQRMKTKVVQR